MPSVACAFPPVLVQMWPGWSPVSLQLRLRRAQSHCRCGSGEPGPDAEKAGASPVPVQMWENSAVIKHASISSASSKFGSRCARYE